MTGRLLTVAEVAELVQCSPRTVRRAIDAGDLRAAQLAARGVWRVRPEDVDAWVDARTMVPVGRVAPVVPQRGMVRSLPARGSRSVVGVLHVPERKTA